VVTVQKGANDWVHVRMKRRDLQLPHVAPLVAYADQVAAAYELAPGAVPYPDPGHGGTEAEVLFVFSHPARVSENSLDGSGLLSLENQDDAAAVCFDHCVRVGLAFDRLMLWNAVPAPLPKGTSQPTSPHVRKGAAWLPGLVELLPRLQVVALLGTVARDAWALTCADNGLPTVVGPSPGARGLKSRGAPERLAEVFDEVAAVVGKAHTS
jgi:hypothetical protein